MRFCPDCGTPHECEGQGATRTDPAVEIARINAERDVTLAKLSAKQEAAWTEHSEAVAEIEAEADVAVAVAEAEVIGAIIDAETPDEPEPVIIDAAPVDAGPEPDAEELPPAEGSPAPEPEARGSRGLGMW